MYENLYGKYDKTLSNRIEILFRKKLRDSAFYGIVCLILALVLSITFFNRDILNTNTQNIKIYHTIYNLFLILVIIM